MATSADAPKTFEDADLRGARFVRTDLSGAVLRGCDVSGADLEAPWLDRGTLLVNGVDVVPYVQAELDRRFPGRALRAAEDLAGLQEAWAAVQRTWDATLERAAALPEDVLHVQVDGEWSFVQTLRHLVMATDTWLGRAILRLEQPYSPLGQPHAEYATDGYDLSVFTATTPSYGEVLAVRAERVATVTGFLADATPELLDEGREHPWGPGHQVSVRHCLHVILDEEWEHHRYAVRDLATATRGPSPDPASLASG